MATAIGSVGRLVLAVAACAAIGGAAASCSLIVDTNADQCKENGDCSKFPGRICQDNVCAAKSCEAPTDCPEGTSCQDKLCKPIEPCTTDAQCNVAAGETCDDGTCVVTGCQTNAECASMGATFICRKDTHKCVNLVNTQCSVVAGKYQDDNAFIIGSILPTVGANDAAGLAMEKGALLAIEDFDQIANGLPPAPGSTARRPIAFVGCTDESNADKAFDAAKHLVDTVGVQTILGAAYSGITIKFTTTVTIPKNVLVISPSATSVAITGLQDNGLVWRTSPSDIFQATALSNYMPLLESKLRTDLGLAAGDQIKVAILYKSDAYGKGLSEALEATLTFNGGKDALANGANYVRTAYGNPDDPTVDPPSYPARVNEMLTFKPHVVFSLGTAEAVTEIMAKIEENWPVSTTYRPRYVFGDGGEVTDLITAIGSDEDLRKRVSGSVPGTKGALFNQFILNYQSKFGTDPDPRVFGPAGAYDTVYMLAYSATSLGEKPLTGPNLADGLKKLVPAMNANQVNVGSSQINSTFTTLLAGNGIDFNGASGPLNFDVGTGEAPSDIQIWCVSATKKFENSDVYYDAATSKLVGTTLGTLCD